MRMLSSGNEAKLKQVLYLPFVEELRLCLLSVKAVLHSGASQVAISRVAAGQIKSSTTSSSAESLPGSFWGSRGCRQLLCGVSEGCVWSVVFMPSGTLAEPHHISGIGEQDVFSYGHLFAGLQHYNCRIFPAAFAVLWTFTGGIWRSWDILYFSVEALWIKEVRSTDLRRSLGAWGCTKSGQCYHFPFGISWPTNTQLQAV